MANKNDLMEWCLEALRALGGSAHHIDVAKYVWQVHEQELRQSGELFYTWQYDLRWAAKKLRDQGELRSVTGGSRGDGIWRLARANDR